MGKEKHLFPSVKKKREKKTFKWPWSDMWKKEFRQVARLNFPLYLYGIVLSLLFFTGRVKKGRDPLHTARHTPFSTSCTGERLKSQSTCPRMSATDKKKRRHSNGREREFSMFFRMFNTQQPQTTFLGTRITSS